MIARQNFWIFYQAGRQSVNKSVVRGGDVGHYYGENYAYPQAANSLREGLKETVTVQELGLPGVLRQALATTNALESVNSQFRTHAKNVKRWSNGDQVLRWLAAASLFIEDHFQRLRGYRDLPIL